MADRVAMAKAARLYRRRRRMIRRHNSSGSGEEYTGEPFAENHLSAEENVKLGLSDHLTEHGGYMDCGKDLPEVGDDVPDDGDADIEPYKGMEFDTYEEAFSFYNDYSKCEGFGVTKRSSHRSMKDNKFIDGKFVCSRYGKRQNTKAKYPRLSAKIDCKAAMHVKKKENDGRWYVYNFIKEHNHELLKGKSHLFRSHRKVNILTKKISDSSCDVGVQMDTFNAEMDGEVCQQEDAETEEGQYLDLEAGDAQAMHEYFINMKEENPFFFYGLNFNKEQRLKNVLWVDAKGRNDYIYFRDAVLFDTTYVKDKCKMLFAQFVGTNHHGQLTLLGCALIVDETFSTLHWLMTTWSRAMGCAAPQVIITDQKKAMKAAIAQVFPGSRHCFCLWHITRQIPEKLGHVVKQHKNFMEKFHKCINRSLTGEEFERRWCKMISKFQLNEEKWLQLLHEERKFWVPTFLKDVLFAGLYTQLRSEHVCSYFDQYMVKKTTLKEFLEQYENALRDRFEKEAMADFQSWHTRPTLNSPSPYESQLSSIYTREIFKKFQVEVMGTRACCVTKQAENGSLVTYKVNDLEQKEEFMVTWSAVESAITCLCQSFEFKGFLCRHALIVLQFSGVSKVPSRYILDRWTKDAKRDPNAQQSSGQFCSELYHQSIRLAEEGSLSQESFEIAVSVLEDGLRKCVGSGIPYSTMQVPGSQLSLASQYW